MSNPCPVEQIKAGYLPGLRDDEVQWQTLRFESREGHALEVAVPQLTAPQMQALAERVRKAADSRLRPMPVAEIIEAIDRAVARLLDRNDPYRQLAERWLPVVSGYDADMVRLGLTGFFKTFRAAQLKRFVAEDFANPAVLDSFQPAAKGGAVRAFGPELLVHSWAGNVPALSLWSLVCGLLVKAPAIGKLASAEPLFAGWFARLLAEVHPPLADCLAVVWWRGARDVLSHAVEPGTPAVALASSVPGPTPVRAFKLSLECNDGWMAMSDAHQLARDVGGGLLLREDHEVRRVELPLWCGDGCHGITLYSRTEARWARFPPTQLPVFRPIDFATLPIPKLATEQERNVATAANDSSSG